MTIEATLERIAVALERQAAALEAPMAAIRAAQTAPAAQPVEAPAKRGPGRPPKSETQAAPAPTPAPAPAPATDILGDDSGDSFLDEDPPAAEPVYTADDVRKALIAYGQMPGRSQEKARKILKDFGHVDTLKALKPEHYKAVIEAARA